VHQGKGKVLVELGVDAQLLQVAAYKNDRQLDGVLRCCLLGRTA
jgi:hypothetical protein